MNAKLPVAALLLSMLATTSLPAMGQNLQGTGDQPPRAIRRDLPHTNMIRRAYEAGTRDLTGRPGPNYWQIWMDYTIEARLDPATATLTGRQTAVIHNNSPNEMTSIQLRLDQNILRPNVIRLRAAPEITDGMTVSRLAINGENVDLNPPPRRGRGGGA